MIRLDTHVVVWLYTGELERVSSPAMTAIEEGGLVISPMVELELSFLHEIGRLTVTGPEITADLRARLGLAFSDQTMSSVVAAATPLVWTRDPFDRMIAGDAVAANAPLLTKNETIRQHVPRARW